MMRLGIANLIRLLLGILLVQVATAVQVYAALQTDKPLLWGVFGSLSLVMGLLCALWFSSLLRHEQKDSVDDIKQRFSKEREKLRVRAEREKTKVIKESHQQLMKNRDHTQKMANLKVGTSFAAVIALGSLMLFTQFVSFGMLLMGTGSGALAGYALRAHQDLRTRRKQPNQSLPRWTSLKRLGMNSSLDQAMTNKSEGDGTQTK